VANKHPKFSRIGLAVAVLTVGAQSLINSASSRLRTLVANQAANSGLVLGANQLTKDLEILFEEFVLGFDAACVISQEADFMYPDQQSMQRAGDTVYRPQDYHMDVVSGLDISAATPTDLIQRQVPATYKSPQNILYTLDAKELRDPQHKEKTGEAAGKRLSAQIDSDLYSAIALQGTNVIKKVGTIAWDDGALAEAVLLAKGMPVATDRKMFFNPFDYKDVAKDLGNRAYMGDLNIDAYERSRVPDIAGFRTFRTDNVQTLAAVGTVSGTTLGAAASFTPSAMTGDVPTDNRRMTITVAGANIANIKNGDCFTIGSGGTAVNSVHNITKDDTGQLQTFRVISGGGTASLVISPAIIATGPYKNCTQAGANGAAITFLNTATKAVNPFWVQGAVELMAGKLAFPQGQGAQVMTATSKQGVPLIMSYAFDHLKAKTTCRFTSLYATTVLQPELAGIIIANQT
jgi:P22 coat protein - gene protein 5